MGRFDKEIRIIREHCYKANLMDLSETTMINKALDVAIECMQKVASYDEVCEEIKRHIRQGDEGGEHDRN